MKLRLLWKVHSRYKFNRFDECPYLLLAAICGRIKLYQMTLKLQLI